MHRITNATASLSPQKAGGLRSKGQNSPDILRKYVEAMTAKPHFHGDDYNVTHLQPQKGNSRADTLRRFTLPEGQGRH